MKIQTLTSLGIDEKAAKIYLASLAHGTSSVQTLANKANIKRPTAYIYINELVQQGLMQKVPMGKKELYCAADPKVLLLRSQHAVSDITLALPELEAMQAEKHKPRVTILEGRQGIRQIYQEIIHANSLRLWSALADVNRLFADEVDVVAQGIRDNQIQTKEIINSSTEHKRASKHFAAVAGKTYSAKVDPTDGIHNDNILYGDVTVLIRIHEFDLYVVRIEDAVITRSQQALFDLAWKSAQSV